MDLDRFVADCIAANNDPHPQAAVLEVLAKAIHNPSAMLTAVGEPREADDQSPASFQVANDPQRGVDATDDLMPHNHLMWANIGIYTGREDNILWRETPDRIEAFGAKALFAGDAVSLPVDVIHSVTNPLLRFTGGIHIYGGDFFDTMRSQWDPETLKKEPSDGASIRRMFELENKRMRGRDKL